MAKSNQRIETYKYLWGKIRLYQYINSIPDDVLAKALDVTPRTLSSYDEFPGHITLGQLDLILYTYGITVEELVDLH